MKWSADSIRWYDVASETPMTTTFLPLLRSRLTSGIKSPSPVTVTGDGDFIPLVSLLRSKGKNVVVIGVSEATSYHLIESADHFVSYASLLEEDRAARTHDREPKRAAADPYEELVRAVQTLKRGGKTRVLGQVKQQMIVQLGSFDERNAGFKKFKDFVVEAERRGLVNTVDQD